MAPAKPKRRNTKKSSSSKKKNTTGHQQQQRTVEDVCEDDEDVCEDDGSALRPIVVLKTRFDMKRYEESEECFILDFDPYEAVNLSKGKKGDDTEEDVVVVYEKGQLACRDYPHPRHLCLKFPFFNSMPESYCKLCYCYVCDTKAPCKNWMSSRPGPGHCHASDSVNEWKILRESLRNPPG